MTPAAAPGSTDRAPSQLAASRPALDSNEPLEHLAYYGSAHIERFFMLGIALTDVLVVSVSTIGMSLLTLMVGDAPPKGPQPVVGTWQVAGITCIGWILILSLAQSRHIRIIGHGSTEYRRVIRASVLLFGWLAIASVLFNVDLPRQQFFCSFITGLTGLVIARKFWRSALIRSRHAGRNIARVLVVGGANSARHTADVLDDDPGSGFTVTGVWIPDCAVPSRSTLPLRNREVPMMGSSQDIGRALSTAKADAVIVTDTEHLGPDGLRSLAWDLAGTEVDLMVYPNVIDVAGPRIHLRPVSSMPFIHLEEPQFASAAQLRKVAFDKVCAIVGLIVLSPVIVLTAAAIKASSRGPIFYRSTRIGVLGEPFEMIKFRSMVVGADQQVEALSSNNEAAGPLFKIKNDPRITRVGRIIRKYSIDEIPQLINVLRGEMSLVGPRPPLPSEVKEYDLEARKRLLVRQGITGLWQISGRSDLSWEESVRLDLNYVENWSMLRDLQIIWKTIRAVARTKGAY